MMRPPDPQLTTVIEDALAPFELEGVDRLAILGSVLCASVPFLVPLTHVEPAIYIGDLAARAMGEDEVPPRKLAVLLALGRHRVELLLDSDASELAPLLGSDWASCTGLREDLPGPALDVADRTLNHSVLSGLGAAGRLHQLVGALQELCLTSFDDSGGRLGLTSARPRENADMARGLAVAEYLIRNAQAERARETDAALSFVQGHLRADPEGGPR